MNKQNSTDKTFFLFENTLEQIYIYYFVCISSSEGHVSSKVVILHTPLPPILDVEDRVDVLF